uniref:Putative ribonuclease H-like domain-containing protein n=1 Tax=Tanacetum cinerariifolium TaxID=118510 RepID=A0A6L2NIL7_TANCI|nr:putative ribonuclease H-like domain-containing protein [Tanacetum cinerariifolium]
MSTQQDIYAVGFENRPPMLNKDNYVPWSSRIIKYARSRPNGKMIVYSIENGPYVRRMIATPGEPDLPVHVPESFHEQTNEELTENDIKRMDADEEAIQTILLGLPEDIYAAVDSVDNTKTTRPQPKSNTKNDRVLSASKSSQNKNKEVDVEEHHRKLLLSRNKKHMSYEWLVHTARTRRPQPKGNTRKDSVPSASKSSEVKKNVIVEDHHRTLLLSKNKKTMSSECNNIKLAIQNDKYEIICDTCKQCLVTANHDACFPSSMNALNSRANNLCANVSLSENQKRHRTQVWKPKQVGSKERLAFGQFCDADLEVAFRRNTYFIRDPDGVDLLKGNHSTNLYTINLYDMASASPISLMARATPTNLQAPVIIVRADNGTEFKNHTLKEYFNSVGITHETSTAKTRQQNVVVERRNRTLVEAARTMLIFSHASLFLWAEAIATACYTQNQTMNITFDELSAMAFEQNSSRPGLQGMTSEQISFELELTYAPSTITPQRPSERDLDILFEPFHNEYLGGRLSTVPRAIPTALVLQNLHALTARMSFQDSSPAPTNSSNTPVSSHNVDAPSQQHAQQLRNLTPSPTASAVDNISNAVFEGDLFVNAFATPSTESVVSSTQYDSGFELTGFSDADYAGCKDTFKGTSGEA